MIHEHRLPTWPAAYQFASLLAFAGWAFITGCGGSLPICVVSGEAYVNDSPAEGVYIILNPVETTSRVPPTGGVSARTDAEGTFELKVIEPGEYAITVFWPQKIVDQEETIEGEDQFAGRYRDPHKPVLSVEIVAGANELPQLKLSL